MRSIYLIFILLLTSLNLFSQTPNWSVEASNFQYSMSVVAVLNIESSESRMLNDSLGAFVGSECRGVSSLQYVSSIDRYVSFLTIYSNSNPDTISLKVYQGSSKKIYNSPNKVNFKSHDVLGLITSPHVVYTTNPPEYISLSQDSILESKPINTLVGSFSTFVKGTSFVFTYSLVTGKGSENNNDFYLIGSDLYTNTILDFEGVKNYNIRVQASHPLSGSIQNEFVIKTKNVAEPAYDISISKSKINENNSNPFFIGILHALDQDFGNTHTYSLAPESMANDNQHFRINRDSLFILLTTDFEKDSLYKVEVITKDNEGLLYQKLLNIQIQDLNETPEIVSDTIYIKEFTLVSTVVEDIEVLDQDLNQSHTFEILDTDQSTFTLDENTGELSILDNTLLDYDITKKINLPISVTDDGAPNLTVTKDLKIFVQDVPEGQLVSDNFFSPNNDGVNDTWQIKNVGIYSDYILTIYDANGNQVYKTKNYANDWDGKKDGKDLPEGVYYFLFKGEFTYRGFIMLMRK